MPRRTDEEIAASLDARASALRQRARIKRDPLYAQAVKLRDMLDEKTSLSFTERDLQERLDAYLKDMP